MGAGTRTTTFALIPLPVIVCALLRTESATDRRRSYGYADIWKLHEHRTRYHICRSWLLLPHALLLQECPCRITQRFFRRRTAQMRVVGGIVSPSHPTLVRQRHRVRAAEIIPPKHRLSMARAAVGEGRCSWFRLNPLERRPAPTCFPGRTTLELDGILRRENNSPR